MAADDVVVQRETLAGAHPDVMLAEVAHLQHGVVSRQQLRAIGLTTEAIRHRVAVSRLHRVDTSVFAVSRQLTAHGRCLAAVLGTGGEAFLSHRCNAALWDLRRWPSGPIHVTTIRRGARSRPSVVVHETRSLAPEEQALRDGIPCTTVARTLVDVAAVGTPAELTRLLEQAVRLNLFDMNAFARYERRGGMARLRRLIEDLPGEPALTSSELERLFLQLVRGHGLPAPVVNGHIGQYQVDFHWPRHRIAVETDGRTHHDNPIAFTRDRRRDLDLELAGWHVLRLGWRQVVDEPRRVVALLRAHLA